jgi:capsular polysaccharide transport system permease protein
MTYVSPRLAEDALYPKRTLIICLVLLSGLALWGGGVGVAAMVRDHMAV